MLRSSLNSIPLLGLVTILFYLPVILNPPLLLNRNNDLEQFFWPIFYYTKQNIVLNHTLPLWNNLFLSGTPLLPDPQSFLFYLPNLLFLFTSIDQGIILSFILHTFIGGLGIFWLSRYKFNFSKISSLYIASLYILTPRLAGYLEAGHFGLVVSLAWLPFILLSIINITKKPTIIWSIVLALALSQVYYTHSVTFLVSVISSIGILLSCLSLGQFKKWPQKIAYFGLGGILTLGFTAVSFLPQMEWTPQTTRSLLLTAPQTYPQWTSIKEILQIIIYPWGLLNGSFWSIDTEKWLSIGLIPSILAFLGFLKLNKKLQIVLAATVIIVALLALNNLSPLYSLLLSQDWYKMVRVSTRFWIVVVFIITFLSGYAVEQLIRHKSFYNLIIPIIALALIESLTLSWTRFFQPPPVQKQFVTPKVLEFIRSDPDKFRVFCVDRCIKQKDAALNKLELIEGYSTLQQINYFKQSWQLAGGYWNYYTLAIPPIGTQNIQPDAASLGKFNTKYIISPYQLTQANLKMIRQIDGFFIYQNLKLLSRAYFKTTNKDVDIQTPLISFFPNHIRVDTSKNISEQLILAEVYSPGWKAYLNGQEEAPVEQTPIALRLVNLKQDTKFVDFKYQPQSFKIGSIITIITVLSAGFILWKKTRP